MAQRTSGSSPRPGEARPVARINGAAAHELDPLRAIPEATIARLAVYLRVLSAITEGDTTVVSSDELALAAGVNSAKLRKDLSYLGSYGTRGVGYEVGTLIGQLSGALGLLQDRSVAIVGLGNLGQALSGYAGFASRGFRIAALFDADPARIGTTIRGLTVRDVAELGHYVAVEGISIGLIAVPVTAAQEVCDALVAADVTSILNFAPTVLSAPEGVDIRKVDLAIELQILSYHEHRKSARPPSALVRGRAQAQLGDR
ncbi:MAG: redox-sensing transcriptional repressor Rex [Mycobacteriales bacterium]